MKLFAALALAWLGIVCSAVVLYLAAMLLVDAWRRRERRIAGEVVAGHLARVIREQLRRRRALELEAFHADYRQATTDANRPPAKVVMISARRGGKLEAERLVLETFQRAGGVVFRPSAVPSFRELQPKFWRKYPGDFIIGERLRLDSRILDGENGPPREEPVGIFNSRPGDPATIAATMHLSPAKLEELHDFIQSPKIQPRPE